MKPGFIGIGAQKCASTWIYQVLSDHPEIFVSAPKELDFFSAYYDRGLQWYESFFAGAKPGLMCGEVSPSYFFDLDSPARAYQYNPAFKVLLNLRDPVERAYSNHLHDIRLEHLTGTDLSFERGLANNPMYVDQGRYGKHLNSWLKYFPREQIHIVLQEDVQKYPIEEAEKLYRFLGIDAQHRSAESQKKANESYMPRSREKEATFQRIGAALRGMGLEWLASFLRDSPVYQRIKAGNRMNIRDIVPPMLEETRERLQAEFAEDIAIVANILGRESLPWKSCNTVEKTVSSNAS